MSATSNIIHRRSNFPTIYHLVHIAINQQYIIHRDQQLSTPSIRGIPGSWSIRTPERMNNTKMVAVIAIADQVPDSAG